MCQIITTVCEGVGPLVDVNQPLFSLPSILSDSFAVSHVQGPLGLIVNVRSHFKLKAKWMGMNSLLL